MNLPAQRNEESSSDRSLDEIKPVSSLIATLPTAAKLHRTIDDFYDQAHSAGPHPIHTVGDVARLTGKRLSYFVIFVALGLANVGDAAEIGSMGFLLAHDGFRQDVVRGLDGLVASSLYAGMLLGGLLAGPLCDATGRRNVLLYGLLLNSSFGVASAMCTESWQIIGCRLLMGLGIGGVVSCLLALTAEHSPPRQRGSYLNFVSAFWTVGSIYVAVLGFLLFGYYDKNWRLFVLLNAAPSLISFALVTCFVPESARFLALHGKYTSATNVANNVARAMGYDGDNPLREDEIRAHFRVSRKPSLLSISRTVYEKPTRTGILLTQSMWFFTSFGSGMCLWIARIFGELSFVNHIYAMAFFFALASIPGVFLGQFVMDRVRRPILLTGALLTTAVALGTFAVLTIFTRVGWLVVLAACMFHSSLVVAWSALSVVTAESFPTAIRSTAMGLCVASGRLASIAVHLVSAPLIAENDTPTGLLLMGTGSLAAAVLVSFLSHFQSRPGTGTPLQDNIGSQLAKRDDQRNLEMATQKREVVQV